MDYKYYSCPVCGANSIVCVRTRLIEGNGIYEYKCNSCDSLFSSEKLYKKDVILKQKEAEKAAKEKADRLEEELSDIKNRIKTINEKPQQIYKRNMNSVLEINCEFDSCFSNGTGIILDKHLIATNAHVVVDENGESPTYCYATFNSSNIRIHLSVIATDINKDIALLKSDVELSDPVSINHGEIETGSACYTLGNAKGQGLSFFNGIIADKERIVDDNKYILFTAPVTSGNSGGPLFDSDGLLIGMVRMGRTDTSAMNYAIPISVIVDFIKGNNSK